MTTDMPQHDALADTQKVMVRNNTRRSLLVRLPGQSIHMLPWTTAEVPLAYLETDALATLLRSGALVMAGRASNPVEAPAGAVVVPVEPGKGRPSKKQK